ncbi:hypothetical protein [Rhizobium leguminosarum]|nr:hypothetical protein [Rhizobium leguminosarum]MBY5863242.1 hypothetical protein [Rhizobium leguminosarum]
MSNHTQEVATWRRRTLMVAGCFVAALIILAFRLIEIEATLAAAARV